MTAMPGSAVVVAKDEQRCIRRCLDSIVDAGFDDVLVVDTGSSDATVTIVREYADRGVRLVCTEWPESFARARNLAIDAVEPGWVMFIDADEWLTPESAESVPALLAGLGARDDAARTAFAPTIRDIDRTSYVDDVPRIFLTGSGIRYRGRVHEYAVLAGAEDAPAEVSTAPITFLHDGYSPGVLDHRVKMTRNLHLLEADLAEVPGNPRWPYFLVRDALPVLSAARIMELCRRLAHLAGNEDIVTGADRTAARTYYRETLRLACYRLVCDGDRNGVERLCADIDAADRIDSPDSHYFRLMVKVLDHTATDNDLQQAIGMRDDDDAMATSTLSQDGSHLDAVLAILLERSRGRATADEYRTLCTPWTDTFFENSALRTAPR